MFVWGLRCRQFLLPRRDRCAADCEDACACAPERGLFALADGASESAQSGLWARLLVEEFVRDGERADWPGWVGPLQRRWAAQALLPVGNPEVPWYVEEMNRHGAFATFLGLSLSPAGVPASAGSSPEDRLKPGLQQWPHEGDWHALAVGDTCLFQVREDTLTVAFPLDHSSQFGSTPWLVGSRTALDGVAIHQSRQREGDWHSGDRLWLMTDALSRWFLEECEAGQHPWKELESLLEQPEDAFADWVAGLRDCKRLRDDDTSLIAVCFP